MTSTNKELRKQIEVLEEKTKIYEKCCLQAQNLAVSLSKQMKTYDQHMALIRRIAMFMHNCERPFSQEECKFLSSQIMDLCKLAEKAGKDEN